MDSRPLRVLHVVGARPNFVKAAPLLAAYEGDRSFEPLLVHTGQHYDPALSGSFFRDLGIRAPDVNLEVGSGSHAAQTAAIMKAFEPVVLDRRPDAVVVLGDVNSTVACGLVAVKLGIPLAHVEAGLRSGDRSMPEEINRIVTDAISDLLFCTERAGVENLAREGIPADRVFLVGNLMADTLLANRERAAASPILDRLGLARRRYAVVTLHRPANVDEGTTLARLLDVLEAVAAELPVVAPLHPRLEAALGRFGLDARLRAMPGLRATEPLGYLDFLKLTENASVVLTDSGGIQEETTVLGVPCLTLRDNTERPVTVETGTNRLVGRDPDRVLAAFREAVSGRWRAGRAPRWWDGRTAGRIVEVLRTKLASAGGRPPAAGEG